MKTVVIRLFLIFFLTREIFSQTNYCSSSLCRGKKHIACGNNGAFSSACGSNVKIMPISRNLRNAIVKKHNQLRNQVAGGSISGYRAATRMATARWNNELAKLAVLNVKQCVMKHDQCRSTNSFKYAGQNLANSAWYGTTKTVRSLAMQHIQMWFDEYKDASMSYINSYSNPSNGKKIGHFTQMVQEKATHLGCGILRQQKGRFSYQFIACNYAYTNVLGQAVYNSGTVASSCTTGRNKNYKNLCSTAESYDVNTLSDA